MGVVTSNHNNFLKQRAQHSLFIWALDGHDNAMLYV